MNNQEIQGSLLKEPSEEDRVKGFLMNMFETIERIWSPKLIDDAYSEYQIQKELEAEMEKESLLSEDDF